MQFTVPVTPQVFHKVFYECKNYQLAPKKDSQEAGELVNDTETVILDRDDIVKVFGAVRLMPGTLCLKHFGHAVPVSVLTSTSPCATGKSRQEVQVHWAWHN